MSKFDKFVRKLPSTVRRLAGKKLVNAVNDRLIGYVQGSGVRSSIGRVMRRIRGGSAMGMMRRIRRRL